MGGRNASSVLQSLQRLFQAGTISGAPEGQLLERFLVERDEAAFEAILARHGPMVVGVCRRLLHDSEDVEDAFQATFLVLVRRARSIGDPNLLGAWLHGVAHRVAVRTRTTSVRRAERERQGSGSAEPDVDPGREAEWRELAPMLDEEVGRLPERYRRAIVLCDLQGLTHDAAARQLGCPIGTLKSRLSRARERLRGRLTRRGITPSAGFLATLACARTTTASLPPPLANSTLRFACALLAGTRLATGPEASPVALLMKGTLATMFVSNLLKIAAWGLLAAGLLVAGVEVVAQFAPPRLGTTQEPAGPSLPEPPNVRSASPKAEAPAVDRPTESAAPKPSQPTRGSVRAIEVRLRSALRKLADAEKLVQKGRADRGSAEEVKTEIGLLNAQIETAQDDLRDELELLKAQRDVKIAEVTVSQAGQTASDTQRERYQDLFQKKAIPQEILNNEKNKVQVQNAQLNVKKAELHEVEVKIGQIERRLSQYEPLVKEFLTPQSEPRAEPSRP